VAWNVLSAEGIETRSRVRLLVSRCRVKGSLLFIKRIADKDCVQIHAGIYLAAVSVGDVLELVAKHPGAFPR